MNRQNPLAYSSEQLQAWKQAGTYQRLRQLESACEPVCRFDGREVINLASNNYLALANHPELVEATDRSDPAIRSRVGSRPHHLGNDDTACRTRGADCGL